MVPTKAFNDRIAELIAEDADFLAKPGDEVTIVLLQSDFTPSDTLTYADIDICEETGLEAKTITAGPQTVINNDDTDGKGILLKEPVGGFNWVLAAPLDPAVTIYGYAIVNTPESLLIATEKLPVAKEMKDIGDAITLSAIFGYLPAEPMNVE